MIEFTFPLFVKHSFENQRKSMHKGFNCKTSSAFSNVLIDPVNDKSFIEVIDKMILGLFDNNFIDFKGSSLQFLLILATPYQLLGGLCPVADNTRSTYSGRRGKV